MRHVRNALWFAVGVALSFVMIGCTTVSEWSDHDRAIEQLREAFRP